MQQLLHPPADAATAIVAARPVLCNEVCCSGRRPDRSPRAWPVARIAARRIDLRPVPRPWQRRSEAHGERPPGQGRPRLHHTHLTARTGFWNTNSYGGGSETEGAEGNGISYKEAFWRFALPFCGLVGSWERWATFAGPSIFGASRPRSCSVLKSLGHFFFFLLATFRISKRAVCCMSQGLGMNDFHDYKDEDDLADAWHGYVYHCSRCGKAFEI